MREILRAAGVGCVLVGFFGLGCGAIVGVDWDRVAVQDGGASSSGFLPDGAPDPGGGDGASACPPPLVSCLAGCCPANPDIGVPLHVAAGISNTCVATSTGHVRCWGANGNGQLGLGEGAPFVTSSSKPLTVARIPSGATRVTVGASHACAIVDGVLACWGSNGGGELGIASNVPAAGPTKVNVTGAPSTVAAGTNATCATVAGGALCWGTNTAYQLGEEVDQSVSTPRAIAQLPAGVTAVVIAQQHACAIMNGSVLCWGSNDAYRLGVVGPNLTGTPTQSGLTAGATALSLGNLHTCALVGDGARCWGGNIWGELGIDAQTPTATPVVPRGLESGVTSLCAGFGHTCAVVRGAVLCSGDNSQGQLGLGDGAVKNLTVPTAVPGLTAMKEVACGTFHTCALGDGGALSCWGTNDQGQLGNATSAPSNKPVPVTWP